MLRKEKLLKLQVLQVKRLKRQLKDLVRSAKPIALPSEAPSYKIPSKPKVSKSKVSERSPHRKNRAVRPTPHLMKNGQSKPGVLSTGNDENSGDGGFDGDLTFLTGGAGVITKLGRMEKVHLTLSMEIHQR